MNAKFVQKGNSLNYTPNDNVAAGDIVIRGGTAGKLVGIAHLDIPANTLGALHMCGVYDVVKDSDSSFAPGDQVYWDAANKVATATADGNQNIGQAIEDADASAAFVRILFKCSEGSGSGGNPFTPGAAIASLTDHSGGSAGNTVPEVEDADTGDALASITAKVNAILAALRSAGIIAQ